MKLKRGRKPGEMTKDIAVARARKSLQLINSSAFQKSAADIVNSSSAGTDRATTNS